MLLLPEPVRAPGGTNVTKPSREATDFYSTPGPLTDLRELASELQTLPSDLAGLARVVQGLLVHAHWAEAYGLSKQSLREDELQLRAAAATLRRALELDPSPLTTPRPPEKRAVGNCRHFSTLLCALLRHQGVPARARCGFGRYFETGRGVDHWICEVAHSGRWQRADAQIDALQRKALKLPFDPLDLPEDAFWVAGRAWQACRSREADPMSFGILDMWGQWFVEGNVCRDLASLHKLELLPWDDWGILRVPQEEHTDEHFELLDRAAAATVDGHDDGLLRNLFEHPSLRVPEVIHSWRPDGLAEVRLADER
jgi:hypothetical protein